MTEAKIDIKIGEIQFSGQGEQDWVAKQLDKILTQAEKLIKLAPTPTSNQGIDADKKPMGNDPTIAKTTLPSFLKDKNATSNQIRKFLATAVWLESKGQNRMQTKDVSSALKDSNQNRLRNPAQCLKQNVGKGYCEKDGKQFFVTAEGKKSL